MLHEPATTYTSQWQGASAAREGPGLREATETQGVCVGGDVSQSRDRRELGARALAWAKSACTLLDNALRAQRGEAALAPLPGHRLVALLQHALLNVQAAMLLEGAPDLVIR